MFPLHHRLRADTHTPGGLAQLISPTSTDNTTRSLSSGAVCVRRDLAITFSKLLRNTADWGG